MLFHQLLRACASRVPGTVTVVGLVNLTNQGADASRTLTITGHSVGDVLIAMTANRTSTPAALLAGYTDIVSLGGGSRSFRVQYKVATATSESITWTGAYGYLMAVRGFAGIGASGTLSSAFGSTLPLPDLDGLDTGGTSLVVAGGFASSGQTAVDAPYELLSSSNNPTGKCVAVVKNNTAASLVGKTITQGGGTGLTYAIELRG
ncbi:hypothetical protein EV674_11569 [Simplicispira metamorpha]|uniref:Uncharacterized protein n=2 Tax=Simplicispira metamorpha TaxID=80881 RepID=A0A4R2N7K0_9BURK|nr:hypothetical protein EV674_11569 [Simplicispira metamorpha]